MDLKEQISEIKYLLNYERGQVVSEQSVFSNLPGVQPDKMDYNRPIPDPVMIPDCFTVLMKLKDNMVSFDKNSLKDEVQKRMSNVDIIFDPNAQSSDLGITVMKDGKPFCFVKK
jgi:hypothetical protein